MANTRRPLSVLLCRLNKVSKHGAYHVSNGGRLQRFSSSTSSIARPDTSRKFPSTMSCWQAFEHGGPDKLMLSNTARVPPIQGPDDVLVEVHASSINPIDVAMLGGYGQHTLSIFRMLQKGPGQTVDYPMTYGRDFSGMVMATGIDVCPRDLKPGDEVWGAVNPFSTLGCHAQYTVTQTNYLSKKPESFSHIEAASLPYVAMSCWSALHTVGGLTEENTRGKRVLVLGATGGVGTVSIQLLTAWGADVTCTCCPTGVDVAASLGGNIILDYTHDDVAQELESMERFDFIFDCFGEKNPSNFMKFLNQNGDSKYVTLSTPILRNNDEYGIPLGLLKTACTYVGNLFYNAPDSTHYKWALFQPNIEVLEVLGALSEKHLMQATVDKVFPFAQIPEAYKYMSKKNKRGKTVIDMETT